MTGEPFSIPENTGRSTEYLIYAACERFGLLPEHFKLLSRVRQVKLVAYEELRQEEERIARSYSSCPFLKG